MEDEVDRSPERQRKTVVTPMVNTLLSHSLIQEKKPRPVGLGMGLDLDAPSSLNLNSELNTR